MTIAPSDYANDPDFAEHVQTYRRFVKGVFLFAAHVLVILAILGYLYG
jgi:hypothetical protein